MTRGLAVLGFWTLVGLAYALQIHLAAATEGRGVPFTISLLRTMPVWLFWAPITPVVAWLARRFRMERGRRVRTIGVHLGSVVVLSALHALFLLWFYLAAGLLEGYTERWTEMLRMMFVSRLYLDLLTYGGILGVVYAIEYHGRFRERDVRASRLAEQLTRARLDALRMQLNPHFLFNALNAVASEVRVKRNDEAITMLSGLGDLLRYALDTDEEPSVPLWKELAVLERYVDIERARFADRLEVTIDVPPDLHDAAVPPLLLQPLVENAIRHGIAPRDAPGRVEVSARAVDDRIAIAVRDDGLGLRDDGIGLRDDGLGLHGAMPGPRGSGNGGIGLRNVRDRLAELYGERHRLELRARPSGGVEVIVEIPHERVAP